MNGPTPSKSRLRRWWRSHFLEAELGVALSGTLAFWACISEHAGHKVVYDFLLGRRATLYTTLATIHGALLGFVLAVTALVLGMVGSETSGFKVLRASAPYPVLWRTFMSAIRVLGVATLCALGALVLDGEPPQTNHWALLMASGTTLAAILRTGRAIWALDNIVTIMTGRQT